MKTLFIKTMVTLVLFVGSAIPTMMSDTNSQNEDLVEKQMMQTVNLKDNSAQQFIMDDLRMDLIQCYLNCITGLQSCIEASGDNPPTHCFRNFRACRDRCDKFFPI